VGTHAGQVSFPGGHIDEGETPEVAALRELAEETDLVAEPLGRWHPVRAVTGTMVTPVLCFIEQELDRDTVQRTANASVEVAQTFSVSLADLCSPYVRTEENLHGRWVMPRFQVDRDGEPYPPIWGLTAFMIDGVMRELLAPQLDLTYPAPDPSSASGEDTSSS